MKKNSYSVLFVILVLGIFVGGCNSSGIIKGQWEEPLEIPNADIVFSTYTDETYGEKRNREILGFYSFEDGSTSYLDLGERYPLVTPFFFSPGNIIGINKTNYVGLSNLNQGYFVSVYDTNNLRCEKFGIWIYPQNGYVLTSNDNGLVLIDPTDCSILKMIISDQELLELNNNYRLSPFAYSENGNFILISFGTDLVRLSLGDKNLYDYERVGIFPVLSPNQKKVANLSNDGIHIMDITGENDTLVVNHLGSLNTEFTHYERGAPPFPFWSSDGEKLVFHKCMLPGVERCHDISEYGIFIYDLQTNAETLLFQGGLYPSWNNN